MEKLNQIQHGQYKLEQLIKLWKPYFFKMAGNFTTNQNIKEDLLAECNVSLWQSNENYNKDKGSSFYTYVATQAKYAMLNYLNQKGTSAATIFIPNNKKEEYSINTISMDASTDDFKAISETIADEIEEDIDESKIIALKQHMSKLKKSYSDIIEIKYLQGYSDTELAEMSGVTKARIGQVVDRSIKILQKEFGAAQVGIVSKKHTKISSKERKLREIHKVK
jgi:RNA polymerase sigma factor (sigma-70 family)